MRTTATFEHGKKMWCVQLLELGPSNVLFYCRSEARAKQLSGAINNGQQISVGNSFLANAEMPHKYENRVAHQRDISILGGDPTL